MKTTRLLIIGIFIALLAVPILFQQDRVAMPEDSAPRVIIITPHNEQIRYEFEVAFAHWHEQHFGEPARVVWSTPGGTSEIRKILESQYRAALRDGRPVGGTADLIFGGGSYEFAQFKRTITVNVDDIERQTTITTPAGFNQQWLDDRYGENRIGDDLLYDPDGHWFGTALSGFGIVYNRDVLSSLEIEPPSHWRDLCHPQLRGWVALVNPGQSGSVTTAFDIILQRLGWQAGWQVLRRAGANARYFSATSSKPPIDISQGDAVMGVCIDFYGRYQAQAIVDAGGRDRVGYIDPPGLSTIDADPIAMLNGAPNAEIAQRFIEFTLTDKAQSLWQFQASPGNLETLGPVQFELRRLPVTRSFYAAHQDRFIDNVNAFELATPIEQPDSNMRSFVTVVFQALAMDVHHDLRAAWTAIVEHPSYPHDHKGIVTADDVDNPTLKQMLTLFDAFPRLPGPDGTEYDLGDVGNLALLRNGWLRGQWSEHGLWHAQASPADVMRRTLGGAIREHYRSIVQISRSG